MAQEVLAPMHDKLIGGSDEPATTAEEDARDQAAVLRHVLDLYPQTVTILDLIREMSGGHSTFTQRDCTRRAVRDLIAGGLLWDVGGGVVQPTRPAVLYHELEEI